ncbi:hypothetical protein ASG49_08670 [Marmoricola sp. Leaf446]|uniref:hypothetical protein n=1 Tax=Marmoricola sp. Leaf446 TaxID=1736379 RepID=UPI0006FB1A86|nr:hypothetical protein [Marmoricola sp. Leaf446]KQT92043.1 hypothetical protein ASG49_08670 [Marmoricola sp. Leaf446]
MTAPPVAQRFVEAIVAKDRDALLELMAPRVRMRGMAPGRTWDSDDATTLVDDVLLGDFFGPQTEITGCRWSRTGAVEDVNSASYQLEMRKDGVDLVCEQHTFFDVEAGRIHALHLMCSGFLPRTGGGGTLD